MAGEKAHLLERKTLLPPLPFLLHEILIRNPWVLDRVPPPPTDPFLVNYLRPWAAIVLSLPWSNTSPLSPDPHVPFPSTPLPRSLYFVYGTLNYPDTPGINQWIVWTAPKSTRTCRGKKKRKMKVNIPFTIPRNTRMGLFIVHFRWLFCLFPAIWQLSLRFQS